MTELAMKKKQRPKNLDLSTIRLPLPGKVSILHRISGVGLFLCLPLILALFQWSLTDSAFELFQAVVANPIGKLVLLGLLWAYLHHFCAGIRFLLLDWHIGIDLPSARKSAGLVLIVSLTLTVILGGCLLW